MTQKNWIIMLLVVAALALAAVTWVIINDARSSVAQIEPEVSTEPAADAPTEAPTVPPVEVPNAPQAEASKEPPAASVTESSEPSQTEPLESGEPYEFVVYDDKPVHYADIAYIGSTNSGNDGSVAIDQSWTENPHSGTSCIKITYLPENAAHWAGGLYLSGAQNFPPNLPVDGVDVSSAKHLSFYARGTGATKFYIEDNAGNQIEQKITFTDNWQQYTLNIPENWQAVCVGFAFVSNSADVGGGVGEIYLDDIVYTE
jgi:hypothetical protein